MLRRYLRVFWMIILTGTALGFRGALPARADPLVVDRPVEYVFGQQITFSADVQSDVAVTEVRFYFRRPEDRIRMWFRPPWMIREF